jgi:hypothetical protein
VTPVANINDRASIESVYPLERFRADANRNSIQNAAILHGVTVLSTPDASGAFHLEHAERQSGERDVTGDSIFVAAMGGAGDLESDRADYTAFIDRVVQAAHAVRKQGANDGRLAGFHGG